MTSDADYLFDFEEDPFYKNDIQEDPSMGLMVDYNGNLGWIGGEEAVRLTRVQDLEYYVTRSCNFGEDNVSQSGEGSLKRVYSLKGKEFPDLFDTMQVAVQCETDENILRFVDRRR